MRHAKIVFLITAAAAALATAPFLAAQAQPKAEAPALVTSCGQSPGPVMLKMLLQKAKVEFDLNTLAGPADLKAKPYKSLIIVMGASLKGMGAAGISIDDELDRIGLLIQEARKLKIKIIGAHIEGLKRRAQGADAGDTTDEQSIDAVAPKSDILLINKEGDSDGRFTTIAKTKGIPLIGAEKNLDLVIELTKLFAK